MIKAVNIPTSFILKLCTMIFFLAIILWRIDYNIFWQTITSSDLLFVVLPAIIFFPSQLLGAYRWYFLLKLLNCRLHFWPVFRYNILGQFAALFLPGQISGDIVRAIAITKGQEDKSVFVLSIIIDKLSMLIAISLFATLGIFLSTVLVGFFAVGLFSLVILISILLVFIMTCRYRGGRISRYISRVDEILPLYLRNKLVMIYGGGSVPRVSFSAMAIILWLGVGSQLLNTIGIAMLAYGLHIVIRPIDWVAINAVVSIVQILPISIGGLGVREGAFAGILSLYAVPIEQSTACSLIGFVLLALLLLCCWIVLDAGYSRSKWFMRFRRLKRHEVR